MKIHYLQHVAFEKLGSIELWAKSHGYPLSATKFYQGDPLPEITSIDWLIVMGGPMNIYEENKYPWLIQEKKFIEQAIKAEKIVIGICLGAQLIADVLGAKIFRNQHQEIGWFPIEFTAKAQRSPLFNFLPQTLNVFHWHGDTFDLPSGTIQLAQSKACFHQGFIYHEKVIAFQFHLEVMLDNVQQLIHHCGDDIKANQYIQTPEEMLAKEDDFRAIKTAMTGILDKLSA